MFGARDIRIWRPDETCEAFQLEMGVTAADLLMGRFTVPNMAVAVISSVFTQTNSMQKKSLQRVVICRGRGDPADFLGRQVSVSGSLTSVEELDTTGVGITGAVAAGFILPAGASVRPCRVILDQGEYEVVHVGTNGLSVCCLHGWIFSGRDRGRS